MTASLIGITGITGITWLTGITGITWLPKYINDWLTDWLTTWNQEMLAHLKKVAAGEDETATRLGCKVLFGKELRAITLVMWMIWAIGRLTHLAFIFICFHFDSGIELLRINLRHGQPQWWPLRKLHLELYRRCVVWIAFRLPLWIYFLDWL